MYISRRTPFSVVFDRYMMVVELVVSPSAVWSESVMSSQQFCPLYVSSLMLSFICDSNDSVPVSS